MDPITHGLLGGAVALALSKKEYARTGFFCGVASAMSPDLDIVIKSHTDPLLALEYHRHFTHSLAFIPLGGLIMAAIMYLLFRRKLSFPTFYLLCTAAFATHSLLDSCTTYGTRLFWPFSDYRVSWDFIAIIDPVFTLILLLSAIIGIVLKSFRTARIGLTLSMFYMCLAIYQHDQATNITFALAKERGHTIEHFQVMPTLGNIVLWRSIYESGGRLYVDSIHTTPLRHYTRAGGSITKFDINKLPALSDVQKEDISRFTHFSNGFVALHPEHPDVIGDMRYAPLPYQITPLWGIKIDPQSRGHVERVSFTSGRGKYLNEFWMSLSDPANHNHN